MPESGDLVGPYRLVSPLGKGAMGEVWRARDERLDRHVALKVLPADLAGDLERRARMLREARAAAAIRHRNVVTLHDIVSHHGDDILVMELVEGRTLSDTLRKDGAPGLEQALQWIEGIADALTAAHAEGILHRDIKAANVMVTPDGVKVLDFGLAKLTGDATEPADRQGPAPSASNARIALDETMASEAPAPVARAAAGIAVATDVTVASTPAVGAPVATDATVASSSKPPSPSSALGRSRADLDTYQTHAGSLLGTPLYMAPEQVAGMAPDERSEVFSVGVLAHEILAGVPPYTATTMDALFRQIAVDPPAPLPDVPGPIVEIVRRALEKEPADRWPSMKALRDAIAAERARRFAPKARRWPLAIAAIAVILAVGGSLYAWRSTRPAPTRPGDEQVVRALADYDVFWNDRALSSLRSALAIAPDHPRANAYLVLFGGASDADRATVVEAAQRARATAGERTKDRALLDAAIALAEQGPAAARMALANAGVRDRELAFWAAEMDYRAGHYASARDAYQALLADPARSLRGRIYDHYSAVLLYGDEPAEALRIGKLYRDAFPGEADAVGVHATTLAAAGNYPEAIAGAEEALRLAEGEDTLAGLAKVVALSGDRARAKQLYQRSLDRAGAGRRPVRRAALAMLHWIDGDADAARATVAPCLPGGGDSTVRERGACLFMAGVLEPARADEIATLLEGLAAEATATRPAYGAPISLAHLVRARAAFFGGACVIAIDDGPGAAPAPDATLGPTYAAPLDFYAAYHVPWFATWQVCEHAAWLAARGERDAALAMLRATAARAPGRPWVQAAIDRLSAAR